MKSTVQDDEVQPVEQDTLYNHRVAVATEAFRNAWAAAWRAIRELPIKNDTQRVIKQYQRERAMYDNMLRQFAEKHSVTTTDIVDGL